MFNMVAAEEMFEKTQYSEMVEKMQRNDGNLSFFNDTLPNWYKRNGRCFTFYYHIGIRRENGLGILLRKLIFGFEQQKFSYYLVNLVNNVHFRLLH